MRNPQGGRGDLSQELDRHCTTSHRDNLRWSQTSVVASDPSSGNGDRPIGESVRPSTVEGLPDYGPHVRQPTTWPARNLPGGFVAPVSELHRRWPSIPGAHREWSRSFFSATVPSVQSAHRPRRESAP